MVDRTEESSKRPRHIGANQAFRAGRGAAAWGWLAISLCSLLFCASTGLELKWPPDFNPVWVLQWTLAFICCFGTCSLARTSKDWRTRLVCTVALFFALFGSLGPTLSYYGNFHDLPWVSVLAFALCATVAPLWGGLRPFGVCSALLFAGLVLREAELPVSPYPKSETSMGLRCTVTKPGEFKLETLDGSAFAARADPRLIQVKTKVGPLMAITCQQVFSDAQLPIPQLRPSVAVYSYRDPKPRWARVYDLLISVPPPREGDGLPDWDHAAQFHFRNLTR